MREITCLDKRNAAILGCDIGVFTCGIVADD